MTTPAKRSGWSPPKPADSPDTDNTAVTSPENIQPPPPKAIRTSGGKVAAVVGTGRSSGCPLYTSEAADDLNPLAPDWLVAVQAKAGLGRGVVRLVR